MLLKYYERTKRDQDLGLINQPELGPGGAVQQFIEGLDTVDDFVEFNGQLPNIVENFTPTGKEFAITNMTSGLEGLQFSKRDQDGLHMYVFDTAATVIRQYDLPTPYDLDTAVNTSHTTVSFPSQLLDFDWSNDGKIIYRLFHPGLGESVISGVTYVTSPWEFTGAPNIGPFFDFQITDLVLSFTFSDDGLRLFILILGSPFKIRQYNLTIPFDVHMSSMSYSGIEKSLPVSFVNSRNIRISKNGRFIFVNDITMATVSRFELTTPNDLSSFNNTLLGALSHTMEADSVTGIDLKQDDTRLYVADSQNTNIVEYEAPTIQGAVEVIQ